MRQAVVVTMLLALAGCAGTTQYVPGPHPCLRGEHTIECQEERYKNAP